MGNVAFGVLRWVLVSFCSVVSFPGTELSVCLLICGFLVRAKSFAICRLKIVLSINL